MNFLMKNPSLSRFNGGQPKSTNNFMSKNLKNKFSYAVVIMLTLLFISCSGDDGAMGPAGANGQDGADGQNGLDGNANVTTVLVEDTRLLSGQDNIIAVNGITQDILDHGAVLVYMRIGDIWYSLPYFGFLNTINVWKIDLNSVILRVDPGNTVLLDFKFVLIAGNSANASANSKTNIFSSLENNGIDVNDYNQVAAFFKLE